MPGGMAFKVRPKLVRRGARVSAIFAACAIALLTIASPSRHAHAETLQEALIAAYRNNPRLDAERARLRATDEDVARAQSGYRPQVGASATIAREDTTSNPGRPTDGTADPWSYQISVTQPLFSGFRTTNEVSQAEALVSAGRENLRRIESQVLLEAVEAYVDVVRDSAIVRIRERNVDVLTRELDAARTRRAAREVTRTDVAQAEARHARALSAADRARANLKASQARYQRVVGHPPDRVSGPPLSNKALPKSLTDALQIAEAEAPNIISALYREEAARYNVDKIWGELLPQVSLDASYTHSGDYSGLYANEKEARIGGRVTVPLYDGGETRARVRQAKHTRVSRLQEIEQARSETEANVRSAWSRLTAARAQLKSDEVEVEASRIALEGTREEEKVGQRLLLDVLNAEQEYLEAQVQAVSTRRDVIVAGYTLLAEIGRLTGEHIEGNALIYDPEEHYRAARDEWFSTDITYRRVSDAVPGEWENADAHYETGALQVEVDHPIVEPQPKRMPKPASPPAQSRSAQPKLRASQPLPPAVEPVPFLPALRRSQD